jgi:multiple sugar transport system permease protein
LAPRHYTRRNTSGREHLGFSSAITVVLLAATIVLSWVIIRAVGWGVRVD